MGAFLKLFLLAILLTTASASFDYWKLAIQWPPAMALGNSNAYVPNPVNFTIHGLWHDNYTSTFTRCPVPQNPFNLNLYSTDFLLRMRHCWPNVQNKGNMNNQAFWTGEWHRHGDCSESQYDQVKYFKLGMDLYDQFDILTALTQASVSSMNHVPLATINNSIISATTKVPILTCFWYNGLETLQEVRVCFNKQLAVIDCPPRNSNNECFGPFVVFA